MKLFLFWNAFILVGLSSAVSIPTLSEHHKLLLISFDGMRWDYIDRVPHLESFKFLKENGVKAEYIRPPFPSQTSPSHTTLATGLYTESHGVVHNVCYNFSSSDLVTETFYSTLALNDWWDNGQEPIWITASSQGLKSAGYLYPGSNATIGGRSATRSILETALTEKDEVAWTKRIDDVISWFTNDDFDFIALYFEQPDLDGHSFGPVDSNIAENTLPLVDRTLKYLLEKIKNAGIQNNLNIIITSDHGMTPINTTVRADDAISIVDYVNMSHILFQYSYAALSLVEPYPEYKEEVYDALKGAHPHMKVYHKEELPERWHYGSSNRVPSIVMTADPGYAIYRKFPGFHYNKGDHGYDNEVIDMRAAYYAIGPSFKMNYSTPGFDSIHVYPLMCYLLGLSPAPNNGSLDVLSPTLRSASTLLHLNFAYVMLTALVTAKMQEG